MLISALDPTYGYYSGPASQSVTPWALGWTVQKDVSAAEVLATGGTYE